MDIKTGREHLIDLRNRIASRIVEQEANAYYWRETAGNSPQNSQEIVDARKKVELDEDGMKKDIVFLRYIDIMLKTQKYS